MAGGNQIASILLTPQAIARDNLNLALDAGWITKVELCGDYPVWDTTGDATPRPRLTLNPANAPAACR